MEKIIGMIVEHGFVVVFLGLCVIFLIGVGKRIFKYVDVVIESKKKKTPEQLDALNKEDNKVDREINNILFDILQKFQPDRIMVLQYHNGSYYNSGQHMKFVSCTHEQPNMGIVPGAMDFQRIPSAVFQPVNGPLMEGENMILYPHVEEDKKENERSKFIRQVYRNLGFKSYYAFALRTHEGHLIGKVTLTGVSKEIIYSHDDLKKIQAQTYKIESLLNYNLLK